MSWTKPGQGYTLQDSISEERMEIPTGAFKQLKKAGIEKLMKKHDAYVSDTGRNVTTISSPKPFKGGSDKDLDKLLKVKGISW
jgi:hypothetical protein